LGYKTSGSFTVSQALPIAASTKPALAPAYQNKGNGRRRGKKGGVKYKTKQKNSKIQKNETKQK
jgi:hypothetical protein